MPLFFITCMRFLWKTLLCLVCSVVHSWCFFFFSLLFFFFSLLLFSVSLLLSIVCKSHCEYKYDHCLFVLLLIFFRFTHTHFNVAALFDTQCIRNALSLPHQFFVHTRAHMERDIAIAIEKNDITVRSQNFETSYGFISKFWIFRTNNYQALSNLFFLSRFMSYAFSFGWFARDICFDFIFLQFCVKSCTKIDIFLCGAHVNDCIAQFVFDIKCQRRRARSLFSIFDWIFERWEKSESICCANNQTFRSVINAFVSLLSIFIVVDLFIYFSSCMRYIYREFWHNFFLRWLLFGGAYTHIFSQRLQIAYQVTTCWIVIEIY